MLLREGVHDPRLAERCPEKNKGGQIFHCPFNSKLKLREEGLKTVPGSPSDLNTGNGTEGVMVCTSLGSLLLPLFYYLCSNLKANPVLG